MFEGAVWDPTTGLVVFVPSTAPCVGTFNPSANTFDCSANANVDGAGADNAFKFSGGVHDPATGLIVFVPRNSGSIGTFDPTTSTFTRVAALDAYFPVPSTDAQFLGAAIDPTSGLVFFAPHKARCIGIFNASSSSFECVDSGWVNLVNGNPTSAFEGAVLDPTSGLIVFSPKNVDCVGVYEPSVSEFTCITTLGTRGTTADTKFGQMAVDTVTGTIVLAPYNADCVGTLRITDCVSDYGSCGIGYYRDSCGMTATGFLEDRSIASYEGACKECTTAASNEYFTGSGGQTDSCATAACGEDVCPGGTRREACGGLSSGFCIACDDTAIPDGFFVQPNETDGCATASCLTIATCSLGEYLRGCGGFAEGSCVPCSRVPGHYFSSNGGIADACGTSACNEEPPCDAGEYRAGCGSYSVGFCTLCTTKSSYEYFTADGGITDSCPTAACANLACPTGYERHGSCGDDTTRSNDGYTCEPCGAGAHRSGAMADCEHCPAGTYQSAANASACISCAAGTANPVRGSSAVAACSPCMPGNFANASTQQSCALCPAGEYQRSYGATACESCIKGFYCREGSAEPVPCPGGTSGNATGMYSVGQCTPVPIGFWAPLGSPVPEACPASGFYCPGALRDERYNGARPIIMPVGQSTETQEVEAVTKELALDISIDEFAEQRAALIAKLALQYGVDPSLITLEASASRRRRLQSSGISITVTIATSDGDGATADLSAIQEAVTAVDDTALASSIGEVMGTPVTVESQPPVVSSVEIEVEIACPPGKWCTAGLIVDCALGSYNPLEDQDFATACVSCPPNSGTLDVSSTSRSDCVCDVGFYDANSSTAIDQALINAMVDGDKDPIVMTADVVDCQICPVGTSCGRGVTLEVLPLLTGYYRLDNSTVDVRVCPDARTNCSSSFGTAECESASGCRGGTGNPCAPLLRGTYCQLCDRIDGQRVFYSPSSEDAPATCKDCGNTLPQTLVLFGAGLGALIALGALAWLCLRRLSTRQLRRLKAANERFTPLNKFKILITFYQICTKISGVYEVTLPNDVNELLDQITVVITLGMTGVATTPLECLGLEGYVWRLRFWMIVPVVIILVIVVAVCAASLCRTSTRARTTAKSDVDHGAAFHLADHDAPERRATFFERMLPAVLTALFFLYPVVTKTAFEGFPCYWFKPIGDAPARGWLRVDVDIECNTPDYEAANLIAWIAVIVYPLGITLFCAALLFRAAPAIIAGKETPLTRAVGALHREYDVTAFWWELAEMGRKFLLVGLFVILEPGSILQIAVGTIVAAAYLMVQLNAQPYRNKADDYLATSCSFALLMVFVCSIIYKFDSLTSSEDLQTKMSEEQKEDFIVDNTLLSMVLILAVVGSVAFAAVLVLVQVLVEIKERAKLRRLKYAADGKWVVCKTLYDPQAFHLFLSHAWPAAQDRMRIVKARFLEALPSCRTFLDVDDLKSGSGTAEVDKSECILVFCTAQYFEKKNSLKELYRAVVQRRPILAMLEPDATQDGGLDVTAVEALITNAKLDKFKLRKKHKEWGDDGDLLLAAFDHAPDEADVRASLFATPPVEWNRLPHFQDVTIRLIAQNGILNGKGGDLYLQGEAATGKVSLPLPLSGREFHLFCSEFNAGAKEFAEELRDAPVFVTKGKKASAPLTFTTNVAKLASCDHMLCLLDERTFASGDDTAKFVEHIHEAMRVGVHVNCIHEFPAVVGPPRHECEFGLFFGDDWTPAHLTGGKTNLYKEIAFALKGVEWRQPGLVAVASKLAGSAGPHKPIEVLVPDSYEPAFGPNPWTAPLSPAQGLPASRLPLPASLLKGASGKLDEIDVVDVLSVDTVALTDAEELAPFADDHLAAPPLPSASHAAAAAMWSERAYSRPGESGERGTDNKSLSDRLKLLFSSTQSQANLNA